MSGTMPPPPRTIRPAPCPVHRASLDGRVRRGHRGLTGHRVAGLQRGLRHLLLLAVGRALDGAPARRVPARGRELERHAFAQREERLHQPLAEGGRADHHRAVVVLERAGDDLRGAGGALVDQHDDRQVGPRLARVVEELLGRAAGAAAGGDDLLLGIEEEVGDLDALVEQAARVVPQVEDERLHPLLLHRGDFLPQLAGGGLAHRVQRDVAGAAVEHRPRGDGADVDLGPRRADT